MRKLLGSMAAAAAVVLALSLCVAGGEQKKASGPAVGQPAPQFSLQDQNGKTVSLGDFAGKVVVLEWTNPQCPFVQRHYQQHTMTSLAGKYGPEGVVWLAVNSTADATGDADKQWADEQHLSYPVLNDSAGTVGHAYGASNTPDLFVVGKDGTLLYKGAIDNDRDGDRQDGKVNYVDKALGEILAGKPVSTPETKPYGCSVHYAK